MVSIHPEVVGQLTTLARQGRVLRVRRWITMNLENNPTPDDLRELIKACDDRAAHHVLWVAKNGDVHVSRAPKDKSPVGCLDAGTEIQLRYETFQAGNEYVGPEAAEDHAWVLQLFNSLMAEWAQAKAQPDIDVAVMLDAVASVQQDEYTMTDAEAKALADTAHKNGPKIPVKFLPARV